MPVTLATTSTTGGQPTRAIDRFSNGARMQLWHNGTTTVFRTSIDGVEWLDPISGSDFGLPGKSLADAYLFIRGDVVYIAVVNVTDNREVRLLRGTTADKRNFTWTSVQVAAGVSGYGAYFPSVMTPYVQGGDLRIPVGWTANGPGGSDIRFRVVNETAGVMAAQATTHTAMYIGIGNVYNRAFWGIDSNRNVHCVWKSYYNTFYVRWGSSGVDSWAAATNAQTASNSSWCAGAMLSSGKFLLIASGSFELRDSAGNAVASGACPLAVDGTNGGLEPTPGGAVFYAGGDGATVYEWDDTNQYWHNGTTLQAAGTTWNRMTISVDEVTGQWDLGYLVGTANPYAVTYDARPGRPSVFPALAGLITASVGARGYQVDYLPNGDAVVMYWDATAGKWKFCVVTAGGTVTVPVTGATFPSAQTGRAWFRVDPDGYIHVLVNKEPVNGWPDDFTGNDTLYYCRASIDAGRSNITWLTTDLTFENTFSYNHVWILFMTAFREASGWMVQATWAEYDRELNGTQYGRFKGLFIQANGTPALQSNPTLYSVQRSGVMTMDYAVFEPDTKKWWIGFDDPLNQDKEARGTYTPGTGGNPGTWTWIIDQPQTFLSAYSSYWGHRAMESGSTYSYLGDGDYAHTQPVGLYLGNTTKRPLPGNPTKGQLETSVFSLIGLQKAQVAWVTKADRQLWTALYDSGVGWGEAKSILDDASVVGVGMYAPPGVNRVPYAARLGYGTTGPLVAGILSVPIRSYHMML